MLSWREIGEHEGGDFDTMRGKAAHVLEPLEEQSKAQLGTAMRVLPYG